jgi:hypothetical protein
LSLKGGKRAIWWKWASNILEGEKIPDKFLCSMYKKDRMQASITIWTIWILHSPWCVLKVCALLTFYSFFRPA